jgi:hypothetical protein
MAWPKGKPRPPGAGRKPGTPNKHDSLARQAIARFAERNVPKIEEWVTQVAKEDPARAAEITLRAIEYHIPKLGRTELTGADGEKLSVSVSINRTVKDGE